MVSPHRPISEQKALGTGIIPAPELLPYRYGGVTDQQAHQVAIAVRVRLAAKLLSHGPAEAVPRVVCTLGPLRPAFPDAGMCCAGAVNAGPDGCTCWTPRYDLAQRKPRKGPWCVRAHWCPDCAYQPSSERRDEPGYMAGLAELDELVATGRPFACRAGMRRVVAWVHPSGASVTPAPGAYDPVVRAGWPYRADGTPAELCTGWAGRRLAYLAKAGVS